MQNRQPIQYGRNTVIIPHPAAKNLRRRNAVGLKNETLDTELKIMTFERKVCATNECVWCKVEFDSYQIRCRVCGNCQYCGMFCPDASGCTNCGNELPADLFTVESNTKQNYRIV